MSWHTTRRAGKHRGKTPAELRQEIERLEDNVARLQLELGTAGVELSGMGCDLEAARAEIARLRALADRPRANVTVLMTGSQPVRMWSPCTTEARRDTSSETTRELPIPGRPRTA